MKRFPLVAVCTGLFAMSLFSQLASSVRATEPVSVSVEFKLTDLDYRPIEGAAVRLVLSAGPGWQKPNVGERFVTNAEGVHRLETRVALESRLHKRPTNFIDSLLSRPEATDFLQVAAELDYAGHRWLYVAEIFHFRRDGLVMLAGRSVYTAEADGAFTRKAQVTDAGWMMADLGGLALSGPGHEVWNFTLRPSKENGARDHWTLQLGFKRAPAPVRR